MKKIFLAVFALMMLNVSYAQTHPKKMKSDSTKMASKPATTSNGVVLKKDGTPDKRYKQSTPAAGPLKKDGTPDKRYKANKTK
ncbi:MAG: hypothetical protein H0X41_05615 [Chitinophagaceae bacterium]|nr:hypothetical protein [Chitinophagaceae bacterium]